MGEAQVVASTWRLVERGRVVLFTRGPQEGRLAAIAEIIDHKRILVDGPASDPKKAVPRHAAAIQDVSLTPIVVPKIAPGAGTAALRKQWQAAEVDKKWDESNWAKTRAKSLRRKELTDFERFKVMRLRKQARFETRKALAKVRTTKA